MNSPQIDEAILSKVTKNLGDWFNEYDGKEVPGVGMIRLFWKEIAEYTIANYLGISAAKPETVTADGDAMLDCPFCRNNPSFCFYYLDKTVSDNDIIQCEICNFYLTRMRWQTRAKATQSDYKQGFSKGAEWMRGEILKYTDINCDFAGKNIHSDYIRALPLTDD